MQAAIDAAEQPSGKATEDQTRRKADALAGVARA